MLQALLLYPLKVEHYRKLLRRQRDMEKLQGFPLRNARLDYQDDDEGDDDLDYDDEDEARDEPDDYEDDDDDDEEY
jgi:hypothetical protein